MTDRATIQRKLNGCADTLRCRLGLAVTNVSITQRHARPLVAEQTGDDG